MQVKTITQSNLEEKIADYEHLVETKQGNQDMLAFYASEIVRMKEELEKEIKDIKKLERNAKKEMVSDDDRVEVIVLITKNDRDYVLDCIKGLFLSEYPFKITVYENSLNTRNTAKIWNKLIKESTCGYILLIDSDGFPQNDIITPMVNVLKTHKKVAVVGPVCGTSGVTTVQSVMHTGRDPFSTDGHISGYCMMFRKDIFDDLPFFDERFVFYGQESDWIEYIHRNTDYKVYVCPQAHVIHGFNGISSTSAKIDEESGRFNFRLDAEYAQALGKIKVKEYEESTDSRS